jgi:hypothetical protein
VAETVGGGSMFAVDFHGKQINAHRESGGTLQAYVELTEPPDWFAAIDFTDQVGATARIAQAGGRRPPRSPGR